jgi:hypothetical protein
VYVLCKRHPLLCLFLALNFAECVRIEFSEVLHIVAKTAAQVMCDSLCDPAI